MAPYTWELTRTFDSEQGEIRWDVQGDGTPVVLTHGTPFSSYIWRDVAVALARHFRVFTWDLAGYGLSARYDGQDVSLEAQTRVFAGLLEQWGLERPCVVGHDFGGAIALRAHLLEGCHYAALVLASAVGIAPWGTGFFHLAREHGRTFERLPDEVHDGLVRGYLRWAHHQAPPQEVIDTMATPWRGPEGKRALYRQIEQNDQGSTDAVQARYGEVNVPTLILWGEQDPWLPVDQAREFHALLPASQLCTIPEAGHLIQHDAPAVVATEISTFLHGLLPARCSQL